LKGQKERHGSLEKFRSRRVPVLFATDVASRGIDITSVDVVINFDTPGSVPDYIHRIGRTARAECTGEAVTLVTQYDVERFLTIEIVFD
jgi:ATP-dependent RNA helicase DDX47/RRP3